MKIYTIIIVLLFGLVSINVSSFAKDYAENDVTQKGDVFYDNKDQPITGRLVSKKNGKKIIITFKAGKKEGDSSVYINNVLRKKDVYVNGQIKEMNTYWSNGKLRTHTPIMARYVNGSLAEKYTNEPTRWFYKNGKMMLEQTLNETKFFDKKGKLLAQASMQNIDKSFCINKGQQIPLLMDKLDILLDEYNRILDNQLDDKEMNFSKFKCL